MGICANALLLYHFPSIDFLDSRTQITGTFISAANHFRQAQIRNFSENQFGIP